MTGFGRADNRAEGREITVEVKTVNHRYLDVAIRAPRTLLFAEDAMRRRCGERLSRGHVEVYVRYKNLRADAHAVSVDMGLVLQYREALKQLAGELNQKNTAKVLDYARFPDVLTVTSPEEDADALQALALQALDEALNGVVAARRAEGQRLRTDMLEKGSSISLLVEKIAERAPCVSAQHGEKLRARLEELLAGAEPVQPERLAQEVAFLADKSCVDEELVRLRAHLAAFYDMMEASQDDVVGRKLDFMIQEFNREANTIGSKSADSEMSAHVIAMKTEIEKLREQAQNLE
ncbi:MAG: YicC family protein [Clostridia bacterium]|nr:YicC family protein [Clostridia bacterium]